MCDFSYFFTTTAGIGSGVSHILLRAVQCGCLQFAGKTVGRDLNVFCSILHCETVTVSLCC